VVVRRGCHHAVVAVSAGPLLWIAERHEGEPKVRVLHVAPTPFGAGGGQLLGGGERYPLELARALARRVDCELVTFGVPGVRRIEGLTIRTLAAPVRLGGHPAHPIAPSLPRAIGAAEIVHVHHMKSTPARVAAVVSRLRGRRVAVTDHGLAGGSWGGLLPRLFDAFLLVSQHSAEVLSAPPAKTHVIYGGADPARFRPHPSPARRDIVFVGRITPHKGVDVLIRALPTGARLVVAGSEGHDPSGPERDYPRLLRRLADGRDVTFAGPVPDDELPALLANAAVVVLPSVRVTYYGRPVPVSELLGLILIESMASGTPVIASRIGGVPEIVEEGVTGCLVEPGNVEQLHDRIAEVVTSRSVTERLAAAGRERVLERYTWDACAESCLSAYEALSARHRPR
jgi:glycosyltransferase involved in cell wall biosynthesis